MKNVLLLAGLMAVSSFSFGQEMHHRPEIENAKKTNILIQMLDSIKSCISYKEELTNKNEILNLLDELGKNHAVIKQAVNDDQRAVFVNAQACFEYILSVFLEKGYLLELVGIIHTPTPATPLCMRAKQITDDLINQKLLWDSDKIYSVKSRAEVLRDFLNRGGHLYVVYPRGGLERRTEEQQSIYRETLASFPKTLHDSCLGINDFDEEMIGATYFFRDSRGKGFVFSLKGVQANSGNTDATWGLWFGKADYPPISLRLKQVLNYLKVNGGPALTF